MKASASGFRMGRYLGTKITALPLHLRLEIGQLSDRHIDVAAADVRSVPEVCGHSDHAPVYPVPLMRPAAVVAPPASVPRRSRRQAAREALNPELAVAGHLTATLVASRDY
jgi:hypothetical protein